MYVVNANFKFPICEFWLLEGSAVVNFVSILLCNPVEIVHRAYMNNAALKRIGF